MTRSSGQLVLVITESWGTSSGLLRRYERAARDWRLVGESTPVVVGRNGLAWGVGEFEPPRLGTGPIKKEGDGRSPAGAFGLNVAFGDAPAADWGDLHVPYMQAKTSVRCVDDSKSHHYNRLVDENEIVSDWRTSESLLREDKLYRVGIVVDHNVRPNPTPGLGSCIFIHAWRSPSEGTAGCTATESSVVEALLRWLNVDLRPVLVQLPNEEYVRLRRSWELP